MIAVDEVLRRAALVVLVLLLLGRLTRGLVAAFRCVSAAGARSSHRGGDLRKSRHVGRKDEGCKQGCFAHDTSGYWLVPCFLRRFCVSWSPDSMILLPVPGSSCLQFSWLKPAS